MKNNIEKENNEMLRNQIKEAQHHSSELKAVVSTSTQVEPWVVAKMERATTDLSDIAHYLDGRKDMKMATGGLTPSQEEKVGKVMHEFKEGKLHSGSKQGPVVTERKQAIAIALAEANAMKKMKQGGTTNDLIKYAPGGKIRNWSSFTIDKMENDFPYKLSKVNQILRKAAKNRNCIVKDFSLSSQTKKYDTFAMLVYIGNVILEDAGSSTVTSSGTYFSKKGLTISFFLRWEARETGGYSNVTINASKDTAGGMSIYKNRQVNNYSDISSYIALILDSNLPNTLKDDVYAQGGSMYKDGGDIVAAMSTVNEIARLTGLRGIAIAEWGDKNNINLTVILKDLKSKKIKGIDLMTAIVGRPNNKYSKQLLATYSKMETGGGVNSYDLTNLPVGATIRAYDPILDAYLKGKIISTTAKGYEVKTIKYGNVPVGYSMIEEVVALPEAQKTEPKRKGFLGLFGKYENGGDVNSRFSSCEKWWDSLSTDQRKKIIKDNDLQFATTNDFDGLTTRGESELKTVFNTINKPKMKDGGPVEKYTVAGREVTIDKNGTNDQTKWTVTFKQTGKKVDYVEVLALIKPRPKLMKTGGGIESMNLDQLLDKVPIFERMHIDGYAEYTRAKMAYDDFNNKTGNKHLSFEEKSQYDNFRKRKLMYQEKYKQNVIAYLNKNNKMKDGGSVDEKVVVKDGKLMYKNETADFSDEWIELKHRNKRAMLGGFRRECKYTYNGVESKVFSSIKAAKNSFKELIDSKSNKMATGGGVEKPKRKKFVLYTNPNNSTNTAYVAIGEDVKEVLSSAREYPGSYHIIYQKTGTDEDLQKAKAMYFNYRFSGNETIMETGGGVDDVIHEDKTLKIVKTFKGTPEEYKEFEIIIGAKKYYCDVYINGNIPERYTNRLERIFRKKYPTIWSDYDKQMEEYEKESIAKKEIEKSVSKPKLSKEDEIIYVISKWRFKTEKEYKEFYKDYFQKYGYDAEPWLKYVWGKKIIDFIGPKDYKKMYNKLRLYTVPDFKIYIKEINSNVRVYQDLLEKDEKMATGGPVEGDLTNLSNLERYVNAHKAEIKANRKTYGFMSVAKITNPYDLSSLLGVDSRIFRNAEIPYYAKFVATLLR